MKRTTIATTLCLICGCVAPQGDTSGEGGATPGVPQNLNRDVPAQTNAGGGGGLIGTAPNLDPNTPPVNNGGTGGV
jgi:hypothetical protein